MFPFILILVLLAKNLLMNREELLSPRTFFLVGCLWVLGFGFLNISLTDPDRTDDAFDQVWLWTIIGLISFELGCMMMKVSRSIRSKRFELVVPLKPARLFWANIFLTLVGASALIWFAQGYGLSPADYVVAMRTNIGTSERADVQRYFGWVIWLGAVGGVLAFALLLWRSWRLWQRAILVCMTLIGIPMAIQGGGRFPLVQYLCCLGLLYYIQQQGRKRKLINIRKYVFVGVCLVLVILGTSVISQLRFRSDTYGVDWSGVQLFEVVRSSSDVNILNSTMAAFEFFPARHEFLYGSTFAVLPVTYIPRNWWPDKPLALGIVMTSIRGITSYSEAVSSIGELYANFGYAGIPVGMFVYGIGCEWLFVVYRKKKLNLPFVVLYVFSLPFFAMHVRGEFVTVWAHYFSSALPLYFALRFAGWKLTASSAKQNRAFSINPANARGVGHSPAILSGEEKVCD